MVYGISNKSAAFLRTFKNGLLNATHRHGQTWLPDSPLPLADCFSAVDPPVCYVACKRNLYIGPPTEISAIIF